jgi:ABC-type glutathione transport system ATPase component
VDDVSLSVEAGETFGLVGESGSGKTTLGKIILGIVRSDSGSVRVDAERVQVIFQDPYSSLDPKMRIGDIVAEGLMLDKKHKVQGVERRKKVEESLEMVKLPVDVINRYPHEFSGGEKQRIAIARAVVTGPDFMVCDEPVSSLDVTIQLQILNLLKDIQKRLSMTYLFISHDLQVVKFMCDRVAVMKSGKIVESGAVADIYSRPTHEYTKSLLVSIPRLKRGQTPFNLDNPHRYY